MSSAFEVNFDGLIGPTHNYAGLSYGNVASMSQKGAVSSPKQAALQGLAKMKLLAELGVPQAVLPPQERPCIYFLWKIGFRGTDAEIVDRAAREAPEFLAAAYSASSMWAANAATVSPSADSGDGLLHITAANLCSQIHRGIESHATSLALRSHFRAPDLREVHGPLPPGQHLCDEGAANHTRLCREFGNPGVEMFVYGRSALDAAVPQPKTYPARQTLEASQAIARLHRLNPERTLFVQQSPAAIDAGVFHNDVIAVGHQHVFLYHEAAYVGGDAPVDEMANRFEAITGTPLTRIKVTEQQVPLGDAVASYLFNSQIVTLPDGSMSIICPVEAIERESTRRFLDELLTMDTPIKSKHAIDLRQSMRNGGGPACLRLRIVLTESQWFSVHPGVRWTSELHKKLRAWVNKHYRDELRPDDLRDPKLIDEGRAALEELTCILKLGEFYGFQH